MSLRMAYVVGTHPTVSTTFIDREVAAVAASGVDVVRVVSIRLPAAEEAVSGSRGISGEHELDPPAVSYLLAGSPWRQARAIVGALLSHPRAVAALCIAFLVRPPNPRRSRLLAAFHLLEGLLAYYQLRGRGVEYVHAHFGDRAASVAKVAARLLGVPFGVTVHGGDLQLEEAALPARLSGASTVTTVSEWNRRQIMRLCPDLPAERIHVLRPFIDLEAIPARRRRASSGPAGRLRIVSVGRLVGKKGHADLIEACRIALAQGVDLECRIVGGGPLEAELRQQAAQVPDGRVELLGSRTFDDVLTELDRADVFALACTAGPDGDRDGMPVSLAEAMAAGLPVISTDFVGVSELVRDGAGILVEPEAPAALAAAIGTIAAEGAQRRAERGRIGRAIVGEHFELRTQAARLAQAMAAAAGTRPAAREAPRDDRPMVLVWGEPFRAARSRLVAQAIGGELVVAVPPGWSRRDGPLRLARRAAGYLAQLAFTVRRLSRRPPALIVQYPPSPAIVVAALYLMLTGRQYVIDAHSGAMLDPRWRRPEWLIRGAFRRSAAVIIHGERWRAPVEGWGGRPILLPDVPGAADHGRPSRTRRRGPGDPFEVVVVASASEDEPLAEIVGAARLAPAVRFRVTGPRPRLNGLRPPANLEFTGLLADDDYFAVLRGADAVMALTTLDDTMQSGACEGMAAGRPIVTSRSQLLRDYFADAAVYVDNDARSIADGIDRLRDDYDAHLAAVARVRTARSAELSRELDRLRHVLGVSGALPGG